MTFPRPTALLPIVRTAATAGALTLGLTGCGVRFIPNTDVEDTSDHRRVVAFCESYRKAVERKDVPTLLGMASPDYYEEGPDADASDDIDYAGLRDYLTRKYDAVTSVRYEIRYRRIGVEHRKCGDAQASCDRILVDYTYSGSYRIASKEGEKWKSTVEENRLELIPSGETFLIVTGM